jgi:hypothetical protein
VGVNFIPPLFLRIGGNILSIRYRKLCADDLSVFIRMRLDQLLEEGAEPSIDLEPHLWEYYIKHLNDNTFVSWLAIEGDRIVGTSGISFVEKPPYYSCPSGWCRRRKTMAVEQCR